MHDDAYQPPDLVQTSLFLAKLPLMYKKAITQSVLIFTQCQGGELLLTQILGKRIQLRFLSSSFPTLFFNLSSENYSSLKRCGSQETNTV